MFSAFHRGNITTFICQDSGEGGSANMDLRAFGDVQSSLQRGGREEEGREVVL